MLGYCKGEWKGRFRVCSWLPQCSANAKWSWKIQKALSIFKFPVTTAKFRMGIQYPNGFSLQTTRLNTLLWKCTVMLTCLNLSKESAALWKECSGVVGLAALQPWAAPPQQGALRGLWSPGKPQEQLGGRVCCPWGFVPLWGPGFEPLPEGLQKRGWFSTCHGQLLTWNKQFSPGVRTSGKHSATQGSVGASPPRLSSALPWTGGAGKGN